MTDPITFQQVQNGIDTGLTVQIDPQLRYLDNGRDLGAFTRVDVLFQAYFVAFLVLRHDGQRRCNPGNPYVGSTKQNGFGTFGGPDFAATIAPSPVSPSTASGIKNGGFHLRHRPESGGAIVRQILTGNGNTLKGHVNDNVLNSQAVQASFDKYRRLLPFAGFSGRLSHPSSLSDRPRHRRRRLHHRPEVLLRRQTSSIPNPVVPTTMGSRSSPTRAAMPAKSRSMAN